MNAAQNTQHLNQPALSQARVMATCRQLTNPAVRLPLPADFPPVFNVDYTHHLGEVLARALAKYGETPETVKRLTVAFPHKDPDLFPYHNNLADFTAQKLVGALKAVTHREAVIEKADGICETVHLGRSENQCILHALTQRQIYRFNEDEQQTPLSFITSNNQPHYFVLADSCVEQGTTLANLASYIQHNGGRVLFAVFNGISAQLVPQRLGQYGTHMITGPRLSAKFARSVCPDNLKLIGDLLAASAVGRGLKLTRNQALAAVERNLNKHGASLTSLTHTESRRLYGGLRQSTIHYADLAGHVSPKRGMR